MRRRLRVSTSVGVATPDDSESDDATTHGVRFLLIYINGATVADNYFQLVSEYESEFKGMDEFLYVLIIKCDIKKITSLKEIILQFYKILSMRISFKRVSYDIT